MIFGHLPHHVENATRAPSLFFFQLASSRESVSPCSKETKFMPKMKTRETHREHNNMELNCLKQFIADERPLDSASYRAALRLRLAIGASRECSEAACRRRDICARSVLDCTHAPKADSFDWDYGWFHCQRKNVYGVDNDEWMAGTLGGSPEFVEAQIQTYRDEYEAFGKEIARKSKK
jgi:hypothetical protein